MGTNEIIIAIQKLPIGKRLFIIEQALKSIREKEITTSMSTAAEALYKEYKSNKDLVALTDIDFENFYETR